MKIGITERGDAGLDLSWKDRLAGMDGVILITKAPHLLLTVPTSEMPEEFVLHCTITGYAGTKVEPNVANLETSLAAYQSWVRRIGEQRCVLRVDPIIPTPKGLNRAKEIVRCAQGRVRISFLDAYPHVRERFKARGLPDLPWEGLHAPLDTRRAALEELRRATSAKLEVCGEPGLECTGCVSSYDLAVFGIPTTAGEKSKQRAACACLATKTELLNKPRPCEHGCAYCYWK